jgi:hypothetical protein
MQAVPDVGPWYCTGCELLQQLAVGLQLITESTHVLYPGGAADQPHHTHAYTWPQYPASARCNRTHVVAAGRSARRAPWHHCLVSCVSLAKHGYMHPYSACHTVLLKSRQHSELLLQRPGISLMTIRLTSSCCSMLGTAAASAELSSEAWLAGPA